MEGTDIVRYRKCFRNLKTFLAFIVLGRREKVQLYT